MLEVVQFEGGTFGIRNTWTGIILDDDNGETLSFETVDEARKKLRERIEEFDNFFSNL